MSVARVVLPGSTRHIPLEAKPIGPAPQSAQAHITVYVRGKSKPLPITRPGHFISNEEYTAAYGASASDFIAVRDFARQYNLTPYDENASTRSIKLRGTIADLSRAFGVSLDHAEIKGKTYRIRTGDITIPENLLPVVTAIVGLDNRPNAEPRVRRFHPRTIAEAVTPQSFSPIAVGQLYDFPSDLDGTGQTIAIIELDGGFLQADLDAFYQGLGLTAPPVTVVSVDGGQNKVPGSTQPPSPTSEELEVALDMQIAGALAPGAKQVVYFSNTSDQGFLDALNAAITAKPQPTVISVSWGKAESGFTAQMRQQFETALSHAAQLGIPVCVASGDNGSFDGTSGLAVDFPASAPHALGCGGTNLLVNGNTISSETVWNAVIHDPATGNPIRQGSGGGVSQFFPTPTYQSTVTVPAPPSGSRTGRGVPDVAGDADPATGYQIRCKGAGAIVGGTSAVAPLWAALIARFGQKLGKPVGFLNTLIYQSGVAPSCFRDVVQGNNDSAGKNGLYQAAKGWDPCTGFGSPRGASLLAKLSAVAPPTPTPTPHPTPPPTPTPHPTPTPTPHPTPPPTPPPTPTPTPHPTPTPTPHPTPTPTPGTGAIGELGGHISYPPLPSPIAAPAQSPLSAILGGGSNSVALVGVVGLAAVVGMVAATGIVATVAIAKEKK
ncbi:MAG: S8/S53 family peptidase [Silvibacterium sp.]|nr:S8/S53 family peptidase [Silvibacterium sp.]